MSTAETGTADGASSAAHAFATRLRGLPVTTDHDHDRLAVVASLGLLLHDHPAAQAAALNAGALELLLATLRTARAPLVRRVALATTLLLLHDSALAQTADALRVLVARTADTNSRSATVLALMALYALVGDSAPRAVAVLHAGVSRPLRRLARDGYGAERDYARHVLATLVAHDEAARTLAELDAVMPLLGDPPSLALEGELWHARDFARCVLAQFIDADDAATTEATLTRLVDALQLPDATPYVKLLALEDLQRLIFDTPRLATTAAATMEEAVIPLCLAQLQDAATPTGQQYAALILLSLLTQNDELRDRIAGDKGVDALLAGLGEGVNASIFVLTGALDADGKRAVVRSAVAGGAIPSVVRVLRDGRVSEVTAAAHALGVFVYSDAAAQIEALDAGAMTTLLRLLRSAGDHSDDAARKLLDALRYLVSANASAQDAFVAAGGATVISALVATRGEYVATVAAGGIMFFVAGHARAQDAFTEAGVVPLLLEKLMNDTGSEASAAASALSALAGGHAANQATILEGPTPARLVQLLRTGSGRAKFFAASTIYFVASGEAGEPTPAAQAAFAEAGAIDALVQLLQAEHEYNLPLLATGALGSLVRQNITNQAAAVQAGAVAPCIDTLLHGLDRYAQTTATTLAYLVDSRTVAADANNPTHNASDLLTLLVDMLATPLLPAQDKSHVALALVDLVSNSGTLQAQAVDAGAMEALVTLADTADSVRACFVSTLACLVPSADVARVLTTGAVDVLVASTHSTPADPSVLVALRAIAETGHPDAVNAVARTELLRSLGRLLEDDATTQQAAALLCALVLTNKLAAAACWDAGIAAPLVRIIAYGRGVSLTRALYSTFALIGGELKKKKVVAEMLPLDALLGILHSPESNDAKTMALVLIGMFVEDDDAARDRAVTAGVVDVIVLLLRENDGSTATPLLMLMACLVGDSCAEVDADAIEFVRDLMNSPDASQTRLAAAVLAATGAAQNVAITWGVLPPLLELVRSDEDDSNDNRAIAATALACLVDDHAANQAAVSAAGAIPLLGKLLLTTAATIAASTATADEKESAGGAQRWTARALANLVRHHPRNAKAVLSVSAVPVLVEMLRLRDQEKTKHRAEGARALRYLLEADAMLTERKSELSARTAALEAGAVGALEDLIHVDGLDDDTMRHATTALAYLVEKPPLPMVTPDAHVACFPPRC